MQQLNPKKPKVKKTYQPTKAQWKLFDVYKFTNFKTPTFKYVPKVNEFVTEYVDKKTIFLQKLLHFPVQVNIKFFINCYLNILCKKLIPRGFPTNATCNFM
jgi:hypothetical protein